MKYINSFFLLFTALAFSIVSQAQNLTLEQAVTIALKNNYDIVIAKNLANQSKNNNTLGNAGILPKIDLSAVGGLANNATHQEFATGQSVNKSGVQSNNITTGAYLTWTIFDGLKMFATHKRLQEMEKMGDLAAKIQIENTLVNVINAYYQIATQQQLIRGLQENISVSEERLKIAQKKFDIGSTAKTEVLQAKLDLNALKSTLIRQKTLLTNAKADLNQLLLQAANQEIAVTDTIPLVNEYQLGKLQNTMLSNNSDLLYAKKNIDIASLAVREGQSAIYPKLSLNANYIFSKAQSQAGLLLLNQNLGLNMGFTASWNVFNGLVTRNTIKNLQLNTLNASYNYENLKSIAQLNLSKAFNKYQDDLSVLRLEEDNQQLAHENLTVALERFKVGTSNSVDLKLAQQSYQDAIVRLADARYNAKISETQLLKLTGDIVK